MTNTGTTTETNLQLVCELAESMELRGTATKPICSIASRAATSSSIRCTSWPRGRRLSIACSIAARSRATCTSAVVHGETLTEPIQSERFIRVYNDEAVTR